MASFLSVLTVIGGIIGFIVFIGGTISAKGAPQEAAAAAMGMAAALIPYVLMRCAQLSAKRDHDAKLLEAVKALAQREPEAPPAARAAPGGIGSTSPMPQRPPA